MGRTSIRQWGDGRGKRRQMGVGCARRSFHVSVGLVSLDRVRNPLVAANPSVASGKRLSADACAGTSVLALGRVAKKRSRQAAVDFFLGELAVEFQPGLALVRPRNMGRGEQSSALEQDV